jgi:hypothetical protein
VQLERLALEVVEQPAEQGQLVIVAQLAPVVDVDAPAGVVRDDRDPAIGSRLNRAPRPQADRRVDRLRIVVKEIKRPDVEGASGQVDPRGRGRLDVHR